MGHILIGTQGWSYPSWVGSFYPSGTHSGDYLRLYAGAFKTVEVDSTFYGPPAEGTVAAWAERTPGDFSFSLKLPRAVSHEAGLADAAHAVGVFVRRARLLGPKLGPVLVQLGPGFGPERRDALERFLPVLPLDVRFAIEFRHARWIEPATLRLLGERGVALALSDGRWIPRDVMLDLVGEPTADFGYVRWMGPDRRIREFSRTLVAREHEIAEWAPRLASLASRVGVVYGYFNNHYAGHSPASARTLLTLLGQNTVQPADLGEQGELF